MLFVLLYESVADLVSVYNKAGMVKFARRPRNDAVPYPFLIFLIIEWFDLIIIIIIF